MRCPDCSKFVSMENGEPEFSGFEVSVDGDADSFSVTITGEVHLDRNCADCGTTLKAADYSIDQDITMDEVTVVDEDKVKRLGKKLQDKPCPDCEGKCYTDESEQDWPRRKAAWLQAAKVDFPVGCQVRVVESDLDEYVKAVGTVADYDIGSKDGADGSWPLIGVVFDKPIVVDGENMLRDGFYDEEIERLP